MLKNSRPMKSIPLKLKIIERGDRILEKFGQAAVSGVEHHTLLTALRDVTSYWKDTFRPALTSFCCEAVGGQPEVADDAGVMFSLAAAGTGIHDDIIDRQLKKRFRITIMSKYGLEIALLVGDLLIIKAWSMLSEIAGITGQSAKVAEIVETYGSLSIKICEAELTEISYRRKLETSLESQQNVLESVNADLEACARVGAILGNGARLENEALSNVGRRLGLMLGLKDDAMDSRNLTGNLKHRLMYESVPLPLLFAAQSSEDRYLRIESILKHQDVITLDTRELVKICFESGAFSYMHNLADQNAKAAIRDLRKLRRTSSRDALELIVARSLKSVARLCAEDLSLRRPHKGP